MENDDDNQTTTKEIFEQAQVCTRVCNRNMSCRHVHKKTFKELHITTHRSNTYWMSATTWTFQKNYQHQYTLVVDVLIKAFKLN